VLGDGGLDVVVDRTRLDDAEQVVRIDFQHLVHPGQVKNDTAADRVGAAGQPGTRAARHDGNPEPGAGADDVLHLGLGAGPHPGHRLPGRSPLGLVVRHGGEHIRVDHETVTGQLPAQRLHQDPGSDHDSTSPSRACIAPA
jgi:hypothetical protein